jgi:hypothetical protein
MFELSSVEICRSLSGEYNTFSIIADPDQSEKLDPDPDPHQSQKQDPDPAPHFKSKFRSCESSERNHGGPQMLSFF